jgi:alpha-1,2-mannosyltransferase
VGITARRAVQVGLVASVIVVMWFLAVHSSLRPVWHHTFDLRVYRGAVRWWLDGHSLYDFVRPHTEKGFTYPPFAVLVLLPLALGTETTATVLLTAVTGGLVALTTWWLVGPVAHRHGWPQWVAFAVALPVTLAMEPVRETLGWGQIDLVIAALVLADVVALRRDRAWAGLGIGLATAIKVTPALFLVYLAASRRWGAAAVAAGTFAVTALLGFAVDPSVRYWTRTLWQTDRVGPPTDPNNQSLLGLVARLAVPGEPNRVLWLVLAGMALTLGITRATLLHRRGDDLAGVTVTGLTACLISPISWVHHLYWVVPAVVVLVDVAAGTPVAEGWGRRRPRAARVTAAAVGLVVAGGFAGSLIWFFVGAPAGPWAGAGENAYVLLVLVLVFLLPARALGRTGHPPGVGSGRLRPRKAWRRGGPGIQAGFRKVREGSAIMLTISSRS